MIESRDAHLVNVLGALALAVTDGIREATEAEAGLSGAAPAALISLRQFLAGRTTDALAQATGLTHSGAVRLVDRLIDGGLVQRRPGTDGRSSSIVLTAKGRTVSRKVTAARARAVETVLDGIGGEDRTALADLVDGLVAGSTRHRLAARERGQPPLGWLCRLCDLNSCGRPKGDCPAASQVNCGVDT